jgi:hypothetical protein
MPSFRRGFLFATFICVTILFTARPSDAQCPQVTVTVDNDIAGSGYSEVNPQNWLSRPVGACSGNYRYLSHTVGDGSRTGKAIWQPAIPHDGWYNIVTSYRATDNRTDDADYYVHDDLGGVTHIVVNQAHNGDCTYEDLGDYYCLAGGNCRLELDGTDDNKSDAADVTTFELVDCDEPVPSNCTGIANHPDYELCNETATTCSGVYTNGDGCNTFCAAAGMECVARYGGEPGCQQEPNYPIPCDENNGHASDWCECAYPPGQDGGVPDGATNADGGPADGTPSTDGALPDLESNPDGPAPQIDANTSPKDGGPADADHMHTPCGGGFMSGCGCRSTCSTAPLSQTRTLLLVVLLLCLTAAAARFV